MSPEYGLPSGTCFLARLERLFNKTRHVSLYILLDCFIFMRDRRHRDLPRASSVMDESGSLPHILPRGAFIEMPKNDVHATSSSCRAYPCQASWRSRGAAR